MSQPIFKSRSPEQVPQTDWLPPEIEKDGKFVRTGITLTESPIGPLSCHSPLPSHYSPFGAARAVHEFLKET